VAAEIEIRPLRPDDDRSGFSCGQPDLDRFFHHYAGQNQFRLHLAVTYVAMAEERLLGFATVSVGSLERRTLPSARLRRRLPSYPLPVLRLARLGVHERAQGLGVGSALLRHVLSLALEQRDSLGGIGVVTDAKPEAVAFYARYGFEALEGVREGALHGGAVPLFLSLGAVAEARERSAVR
jgi:GNAT superfamily N-acetyltransferase